jgi:hypothetical protein
MKYHAYVTADVLVLCYVIIRYSPVRSPSQERKRHMIARVVYNYLWPLICESSVKPIINSNRVYSH